MIQFLVDECLSPELVHVAREHGFNAYHVTRRGWSADPDPQLLGHILNEDLTFVTNNWKDFRPMLSRTEVHPGVIAILPNARRQRQMELFATALGVIQGADPPLDMVNLVLEVNADGEVERYDLPPST